MKSIVFPWIFSLLVIILDQSSKWYVLKTYPNWVIFNTHGTWGLLPVWVGGVGVVVLLFLYFNKVLTLPYFLVLMAAGLSNLVDRWLYPGVVDFIHVGSFLVFNLADVTISLTLGRLLYSELFPKQSQSL